MTPPLQVLLTVASLDPLHGGTSRTVTLLAGALRRLGVSAMAAEGADAVSRTPAAGLVHDNGVWLAFNHAVARAAARAGIPRVVSPHGMLEPWALGQKRLKKAAAWHLYQRHDLRTAAALHATSEAEVESIRQLGLRTPVALVPNGVDVPEALPAWNRGETRRALFLSRLHPKKGLPMLVDAWARVRPAGWELVLAGPDDGDGHRAHVEALVQAAGLADVVSFTGTVSDADKWALYRTADLFVLPTHSENFGLVVAEALGAGVPVLTTTGAPWRELITLGCGWQADITVDSIAAALAQATRTSRGDLDTMGARGQALVHSRYGWDGVAGQMIAVYEWIKEYGDRPPFVSS